LAIQIISASFFYSTSNIFSGFIVIIYGTFDFIFIMVLVNEKVILKGHVPGADGSTIDTQ